MLQRIAGAAVTAAMLLTLAACGQSQTIAPTQLPTAASIQAPTLAPTSAPPVAPTAAPTAAPATSAPALPTAVVTRTIVEAHFAWPASFPAGQQLQADRSTINENQLMLELANPANAQDYVVISSAPDTGEDLPAMCREAVTVRGLPGFSCTTGGGTTIQWVEQGWRYSIGGALMSAERAIAIAETLEFVDLATAQERLGRR